MICFFSGERNHGHPIQFRIFPATMRQGHSESAVHQRTSSWPQVNVTSMCFLCKMPVQANAFRSHMFDFHGQRMPFICLICGKGYQSSQGLTHHTRLHQGKTFFCPVCDAKFTQNAAMKTHLKKFHDSVLCSACFGVFKQGLEFSQHVLFCKKIGQT